MSVKRQLVLNIVGTYIVPILFFGIFLPIQIYNVQVNNMTVWKGGGMGMFSSTDSPARRVADMYIMHRETQKTFPVVLDFDKRLNSLFTRYEIRPTENNVRKIEKYLEEKKTFVRFVNGIAFVEYEKQTDSVNLLDDQYNIVLRLHIMNVLPREENKIQSVMIAFDNWLLFQ